VLFLVFEHRAEVWARLTARQVTAMLPLISGLEMRFNYIDLTSGDNYILQHLALASNSAVISTVIAASSSTVRLQTQPASMTVLALMLLASSLTTAVHVGGQTVLVELQASCTAREMG